MSPPLAHRCVGHPLTLVVLCPGLHALICILLGRVRCSLPRGLTLSLPHSGALLKTIYVALSCGMAALRGLRYGANVWISHTAQIRCSADQAACSRFLLEQHNLVQYEQKVSGCRVWGHHEGGCFTQMWGWWWVFPWCKTFRITYKEDGGFHAAMDDGGWENLVPACLRLCGGGGFKIQKRADNTCSIVHYERYGWPLAFPLIWLFELPWLAWHRRGMEVEMQVIRAQIEEIQQGGLAHKSAAVADCFPADTWTAWKYTAMHYLAERFGLCGPVKHPRVAIGIGSHGESQHLIPSSSE